MKQLTPGSEPGLLRLPIPWRGDMPLYKLDRYVRHEGRGFLAILVWKWGTFWGSTHLAPYP